MRMLYKGKTDKARRPPREVATDSPPVIEPQPAGRSDLPIAMVDSTHGCRPFNRGQETAPTVIVGRSTKKDAAPHRERFLVCVGERDIRPGETA